MNVNTRDLGFIKFNGEEMNWFKFNGVTVYESWRELIASGVPPLSIYSSGRDLLNYKMYGNSRQDGVPTPEAPIEVESVGIKTPNLYDKEKYPLDIGFWVNPDNGSVSTSTNYNATKLEMPIEPNTTYTINHISANDASSVVFYDADKKYISGTRNGVGFTTPSNCKYIRFSVGINVDPNTVQMNYGTEILGFEPFGYRIPVRASNGKEEVITNIYLHEPLRKINEHIDYIDFEKGIVYRAIQKFYIKDFVWSKHATYPYIYSVYSSLLGGSTGVNPISNILDSTSYLPPKSIKDMTKDYCIKMHNTSMSLYISDSVHTTAEEMVNYLGNGYFIIIAQTPTEETIELPNIKTLKGNITIDIDDSIQPSNMEIVYMGK